MYRVKMLLINLLLCGTAGFLMRLIWVVISQEWDEFVPEAVLSNVFISGVIGTICLSSIFTVTLFVKSTRKMVVAINMAVCLLLLVVVYVATGIAYDLWTLDLSWLVILIVSELTTLFLSRYWYNKIYFYNSRLAEKKKSLGLSEKSGRA